MAHLQCEQSDYTIITYSTLISTILSKMLKEKTEKLKNGIELSGGCDIRLESGII
jgi:hypothetical protein